MDSPHPFHLALWCLGAFLCGSIPFGLLVVRVLGKGDVRSQGSGNIGATNVSRVAGKGVGILVLLLDAAKGFGPVFAALHGGLPQEAVSVVALMAVAGHMFTPWLTFKGGKGVATAVGAALAFRWIAVMPCLGLFMVMLGLFRYVSLGSILAAALLPFTLGWAQGAFGKDRSSYLHSPPESPWVLVAWSVISLLVILKHRENIGRLWKGTESKLWGPKPMDGFNA